MAPWHSVDYLQSDQKYYSGVGTRCPIHDKYEGSIEPSAN